MRKIAKIALALLLLTITVAACGRGNGNDSDATISVMSAEATATADITTAKSPISTDEPTNETTDQQEHIYGEWKVGKAATCMVDGEEVRMCTSCSKTETRVLAATGHVYGEWITSSEATCVKDGQQKRTCTSCSKAETKSIAATGHIWSAWETTKAATETEKGEQKRTCETCKTTETREIDTVAHEHSFGEWVLNDDYINETRTCETCGATETQKHKANPDTDESLVADRVIYYINQYREAEGTTAATKLDRLTLVAEMRSTQLVGLTVDSPYEEWHSTEDLRECGAYYEYGKTQTALITQKPKK